MAKTIVDESGEIYRGGNEMEDMMRATSGAWVLWLDELRAFIHRTTITGQIEKMVDEEIRKRWVDKCAENKTNSIDEKGRPVYPPVPTTPEMEQYRERRMNAAVNARNALMARFPVNPGETYQQWANRVVCYLSGDGKREAGKIMLASGMICDEPSKRKART
jgi:hypothetical protein